MLVSISVSCQSAPSSPAPSVIPGSTPRITPTLVSSVTPSTANNISRGTPTGGAITLAGIPGYFGTDTDGNGLFEWLQVNVPVKVARAGEYFFDAYISDGQHSWLPMQGLDTERDRAMRLSHAELDAGAHTVAVYFDGKALREFGMDGPYTIVVYVHDYGVQDPSDSIKFSTLAYKSRDFQGLLIENLSLSDSGVDMDGVPGYDALRVSAHFNMAAAGTVSGQAILFGGDMRLETLDLPAVQLAAGPQTLEIDFLGAMIFANRVDGPYGVSVDLRDQYFPADGQWYTTADYTHDQFQVPPAHFTENTEETGNDLNGDGAYDELLISTQVVARDAGTYRITSILEDRTGRSIDTYSSEITLFDTLPQTVTLHFRGIVIARRGADGPYHMIVVVEEGVPNSDYVTLDGLSYETKAYPVTAFQQPGARLSGMITDSGVDTDGDGGYNVLHFSVGVTVTQAGRYSLSAGLHDAQGNFIAVAQTEEIFLETGAHTVDLDFSGATLRDRKTDGPYQLAALEVDQEGGEMLDYRLGDYLTAAYPYTAFRPAGPMLSDTFSDQGVDTNGNGLYENLTIRVKVSIVKAGQYDFNAGLYEINTRQGYSIGKEIVRTVGRKYLEVGDQWIALEFDGRYIYGQQANGPYKMGSFMLYFNYPEQVLGEGMPIYTTGAYDWHDFEPGVAISGTVSGAGKPLEDVLVYIGGVDTDETDAGGHYRLTTLNTGPVTIGIDPTQGPWQIWVNGKLETIGASVTIQAVVGTQIEVNFIKAP